MKIERKTKQTILIVVSEMEWQWDLTLFDHAFQSRTRYEVLSVYQASAQCVGLMLDTAHFFLITVSRARDK